LLINFIIIIIYWFVRCYPSRTSDQKWLFRPLPLPPTNVQIVSRVNIRKNKIRTLKVQKKLRLWVTTSPRPRPSTLVHIPPPFDRTSLMDGHCNIKLSKSYELKKTFVELTRMPITFSSHLKQFNVILIISFN